MALFYILLISLVGNDCILMSASSFSLLKYHMSYGLWNTTPGGASGKEPQCRRLKSHEVQSLDGKDPLE